MTAGALDADESIEVNPGLCTAFPDAEGATRDSAAIERDPGRALHGRGADRAELRRLRRERREWSRQARRRDAGEWRRLP